MTDQQEPTLSERLRDLGPDNSGFRKIGLEAAATIDRLTAALAEATKPDHALHPLSEIREWDEALSELGIQDSVRTPTEAIRELKARIEELDAGVSDIKRAMIEGRVCDDIAWYDEITTLHDFCELLLDTPIARALLTGGGSNG